jgi:hypothetical protein
MDEDALKRIEKGLHSIDVSLCLIAFTLFLIFLQGCFTK